MPNVYRDLAHVFAELSGGTGLREQGAQLVLERPDVFAEQVRCRVRQRENTRNYLVVAAIGDPPRYVQPRWANEARCPEDLGLDPPALIVAAGLHLPVSAPRAALLTEKLLDEGIDLLPGRSGMWQRSRALHALVGGGMDEGEGTVFAEQLTQQPCNSFPVHPMKGLRHRRRAESAKRTRQLFGPGVDPLDVPDAGRSRLACAFGQHLLVCVHTDDLLTVSRQRQGERSGTAPHIQQAPPAIETELGSQKIDECRRVRHPSPHVIGGAARIQRRIPLPPSTSHGVSHPPQSPGEPDAGQPRPFCPVGADLMTLWMAPLAGMLEIRLTPRHEHPHGDFDTGEEPTYGHEARGSHHSGFRCRSREEVLRESRVEVGRDAARCRAIHAAWFLVFGSVRPEPYFGRAGISREYVLDCVGHRGRTRRAGRGRRRDRRDLSPWPEWSGKRSGPRASQLLLPGHLPRPGRQPLVAPGSHNPASRAGRSVDDVV